MTDPGAYASLAAFLQIPELLKLRDAFAMGESCKQASKQLTGKRGHQTVVLLTGAGLDDVARDYRVGLMEALLGVRQSVDNEAEPVWTMPEGTIVAGHTTSPMTYEIEKAEHSVLASTFNLEVDSGFISALSNVANRGVAVTLLASPGGIHGPKKGLLEVAPFLSHQIPGARFLTLAESSDGGYRVLHSKFLVIDRRTAFIGSANFSSAASSKNVELGVLLRSPELADKLHRDVDSFVNQGVLIPVPPAISTPS